MMIMIKQSQTGIGGISTTANSDYTIDEWVAACAYTKEEEEEEEEEE